MNHNALKILGILSSIATIAILVISTQSLKGGNDSSEISEATPDQSHLKRAQTDDFPEAYIAHHFDYPVDRKSVV